MSQSQGFGGGHMIRDVTRPAWPSLAAADHATSLGLDICAAGNLVRSVVDL